MKTHHTLFVILLIVVYSVCACTDNDAPKTPSGQDPTPQDPNPQTPPVEKPPTPVQPPETIPHTLRIATWNVHNLFDTQCDSPSGCGGSNYEPKVTETNYRSKVLSVGDGIKQLDADVILLQEIEKESCLIDVQEWIGVNQYPSYTFGEMGTNASLDVSIITRGTITKVQTYRNKHWITQPDGSQKRLARELLAAEITLPNGVELTAFTTHFVSKISDSEGTRRLGEAKLTREILDAYIDEHPGRFVIFGGDLNDFPDSEQIQTLSGDDHLASVTAGMAPEAITTWNDSVTFDYLFYTAGDKDKLKKTEIFCDEYRSNGYHSSDHCAVRSEFEFE